MSAVEITNLFADRLVGVDVGVIETRIGILTTDGEMVDAWEFPTDTSDGGSHIIPAVIEALNRRFSEHEDEKPRVMGVGICTSGVVDSDAGVVMAAYDLNWAQPQNVARDVSTAVGLPVIVDNNAYTAALGSNWVGVGKDVANLVYLRISGGVNAGIIAASKLIRGAIGGAGEVGHICVEPDGGLKCSCGNHGCFETVASSHGVVELAKTMAPDYPAPSPLKASIQNGDSITLKMIYDGARNGDALCEAVVEKLAHYIGRVCATLGVILNPDIIVIGGRIVEDADFLLEKFNEEFKDHSIPGIYESTRLALNSLGLRAGVYGAAKLVLELRRKQALRSFR